MRNSKIVFCFNSLIWMILFLGSTCQASQAERELKSGAYANYNILFVSFDALQAAHASCFGYFRKTTPTIDRLAGGGFLFKNAISQSSWTIPATMSWFTSLYPSQHKCVNQYSIYTEKEKIFANLRKLSPGVVTLAEILRRQGYIAAGFTGDSGVGSEFGFKQGFKRYFEGPKFGGMDKSIPEAIHWLKKHRGKRFFMFLHGYDCHGQYDPPRGYNRRFVDFDYKGMLKGGKSEQMRLREEGLNGGALDLTESDVRFWRALYDEKINDADERFGEFMKEFERLGLLDKTVIVLVSDHGTEFYEHGRFDHGFSLYDELIHVPLVFWLPRAKGGVTIGEQVRAIDIMPTLLDLLGVRLSEEAKGQMEGISLLPLMRGEHMDLDAFSETDYRFCTFKRSIRTTGGWKFIYTMETGKKELYNLREDPGETNNLVGKEGRVTYELEQRLFQWMKSMGQNESSYKESLKKVLRIKEYY